MADTSNNDKESVLDNEVNNDESSEESATSSNQSNKTQPAQQEDKIYENIRGHERHILSHFFIIFSISFIVGVLCIHSSLWLSAYLFTSEADLSSEVSDYSSTQSNEYHHQTTQTDQQHSILHADTKLFHYTGTYFRRPIVTNFTEGLLPPDSPNT